MASTVKKKSPKSRRNDRIIILLFLACFVYLSYIVLGYQQNIVKVKKTKLQEMQCKIQQEMEINKKLRAEKTDVNSDQYIEAMARKHLGMIKYGEKLFVDISK